MAEAPAQLALPLPSPPGGPTGDAAAGPPRQLALDLPTPESFAAEDFLVGRSNERAHGLLERWPGWPDRLLFLVGPEGCGKSHLAAMWAARSEAAILPAATVDGEAVRGLGGQRALAIEDIDRGRRDEPALFHLLNLARERGIHLLLTSAAAPDGCGLRIPDLLSRLRLVPSVEIGAPDDDLLKAVLVKLFVDRQLMVDESVIEFLAARIERSLAAARRVVAALDREALSLGRRVTRPVAADTLHRLGATAVG